jgi:hypothetical protein
MVNVGVTDFMDSLAESGSPKDCMSNVNFMDVFRQKSLKCLFPKGPVADELDSEKTLQNSNRICNLQTSHSTKNAIQHQRSYARLELRPIFGIAKLKRQPTGRIGLRLEKRCLRMLELTEGIESTALNHAAKRTQ